MRQGQQQNRSRSRGRNNNNRNNNNNNRNQLNRSMESNGPDVRIRGTAAHIAEKYTTLARDAQTSGDTVAAESYWQFAEHYNRLIAIAQAAQAEEQAKRDEERAKRDAERAERGESNDDGDGDDNRNRGRGRGRARQRNQEDGDGENTSSDPAEAPQPVLEEASAKSDDVEAEAGEDKPSKPRRASARPRKKVEKPTEDSAAEGELPAFISGAAE
jgi:hypothetical protein